MSATTKDAVAADEKLTRQERHAAQLKLIRARAKLLEDVDPWDLTQARKAASGYRAGRRTVKSEEFRVQSWEGAEAVMAG